MSEKPEALRLADALDAWDGKLMMPKGWRESTAAELRRLHAENESLRQIIQDFPPVEAELREVSDRAHRLEQQRDALLEALRAMRVKYGQYACRVCDLADVAIAKAEGEGA